MILETKPHSFKKQSVMKIVDAATTRVEEYAAAGFNVTLRQLFYRLVSDGVLFNRIADYRNLGR